MKSFIFVLLILLAAPAFAHGDNQLQLTAEDGTLIATVYEGENGEATVVLASGQTVDIDGQFRSLSEALLQANEKEKPGILKRFIKNQQINVIIEENGSASITAGLKVNQNAQVSEVRLGKFADSTVDMYVDKATFSEKEATLDTLSQAIKNKEIRLEAHGFGNIIKVGILKMGVKIASWFN